MNIHTDTTAAAEGARAADINNVLDAADVMFEARKLIECIFLASSAIGQDGETVAAVATIAIEKLLEAREMLQGFVEGTKGGAAI